MNLVLLSAHWNFDPSLTNISSITVYFKVVFFFNIYLFGYTGSNSCGIYDLQLMTSELLVVRHDAFSDQGLNLGPPNWEHEVLATGPPGNSHSVHF